MKKLLLSIITIIALVSLTGCVSEEESAIMEIEKDILKLEYSGNYGTSNTIGKVQSVNCSVSENDNNGRYLLNCKVRYNPKQYSGETDLTKEYTDNIIALYAKKNSNQFVRTYGSSIQKQVLKTEFCWEKSSSDGYSCE